MVDYTLIQLKLMPSSSRITATLPVSVLNTLGKVAAYQGRSVSNLTAYIIESYLKQHNQTTK
jgi:hypothetical protein